MKIPTVPMFFARMEEDPFLLLSIYLRDINLFGETRAIFIRWNFVLSIKIRHRLRNILKTQITEKHNGNQLVTKVTLPDCAPLPPPPPPPPTPTGSVSMVYVQ